MHCFDHLEETIGKQPENKEHIEYKDIYALMLWGYNWFTGAIYVRDR